MIDTDSLDKIFKQIKLVVDTHKLAEGDSKTKICFKTQVGKLKAKDALEEKKSARKRSQKKKKKPVQN